MLRYVWKVKLGILGQCLPTQSQLFSVNRWQLFWWKVYNTFHRYLLKIQPRRIHLDPILKSWKLHWITFWFTVEWFLYCSTSQWNQRNWRFTFKAINGTSRTLRKTKTFNHNGDINEASRMLHKTKMFNHNGDINGNSRTLHQNGERAALTDNRCVMSMIILSLCMHSGYK